VRNFRPQFQQPELFQLIDNLSIVRGKHSIRSGFETRQKNNSFAPCAIAARFIPTAQLIRIVVSIVRNAARMTP